MLISLLRPHFFGESARVLPPRIEEARSRALRVGINKYIRQTQRKELLMKKLMLLLGLGAGFVLGSRAGRGPYEQLEGNVRRIAGRPEVQDTVAQAKDAARQTTQKVMDKVNDTVSTAKEGSSTLVG